MMTAQLPVAPREEGRPGGFQVIEVGSWRDAEVPAASEVIWVGLEMRIGIEPTCDLGSSSSGDFPEAVPKLDFEKVLGGRLRSDWSCRDRDEACDEN